MEEMLWNARQNMSPDYEYEQLQQELAQARAERERAREALRELNACCLSGDETRLLMVGLAANKMTPELYARCDRITRAQELARVALATPPGRGPSDVDRLREVLQALEWTPVLLPDVDGRYCPGCGNTEQRGHMQSCEVAAVLRETGGR